MNSVDIIESPKAQKMILVPENKEVESIHYTDGTCSLFLDLDNETLALLYQMAHDKDMSVDQVVEEALESYLDYYEVSEEDLQDEEDDWEYSVDDDNVDTFVYEENKCQNCCCDKQCKEDLVDYEFEEFKEDLSAWKRLKRLAGVLK